MYNTTYVRFCEDFNNMSQENFLITIFVEGMSSDEEDICGFDDEAVLVNANESVLEKDIKKIWCMVGGYNDDFSESTMDYFLKVIGINPTGDSLLKQFAVDGVTVIPGLFPQKSRREAFNLTKKFFEQLLFHTSSPNQVTKVVSTPELTIDYRRIISYIGGYILHKLKKRKSGVDDSSVRFLDTLCNVNGCVDQQSLIGILSNPKYGSLQVPNQNVVNMLMYVEKKFRQLKDTDNFLGRITLSLNMEYIYIITDVCNWDTSNCKVERKCIDLICQYYLKMRAHHKAKTLKQEVKVNSSKKALRKSLASD